MRGGAMLRQAGLADSLLHLLGGGHSRYGLSTVPTQQVSRL